MLLTLVCRLRDHVLRLVASPGIIALLPSLERKELVALGAVLVVWAIPYWIRRLTLRACA